MSIENVEHGSRCAADCGFGASSDGIDCLPDGDGCGMAFLLEADESEFHDRYMVEATKAFNAILNMMPEDPKGRKPSFIHTRMGTMLAWVDHNANECEHQVTHESDDLKIAEVLGIRNFGAKGAIQAS
ncbi:MAG: hypothetical protein HKN25_12505 [Pyrinomonadaceae bacterium]|nr:hypothetical protein [Pyrinomonadaceae bacterium]